MYLSLGLLIGDAAEPASGQGQLSTVWFHSKPDASSYLAIESTTPAGWRRSRCKKGAARLVSCTTGAAAAMSRKLCQKTCNSYTVIFTQRPAVH